MSCPHTVPNAIYSCQSCILIAASQSAKVNQTILTLQGQLGATQQNNFGNYTLTNNGFQSKTPDFDYEMFLKYGPLEDGELYRVYCEEHKLFEHDLENKIAAMRESVRQTQEMHEIRFFEWCSKYKKKVTKEKLDAYWKVFL